ncbi:MAG TPA: sulfatase-like hydrolase/transferase, partial [Thermoanaerobaculia bacterium]|nr:sulfatase-like hydrolase/transferase [Thermoanaerobaculia bacterium]
MLVSGLGRRPRPPALVLALALTAGGGLSACGPRAPEGPWNVLFVLVDTLRADHLSLYGYARETSPGLDRLGREAIVFDRVQAQAGCTFPSVNSLLTSRYPAEFVSRAGRSPVGRREMGIPEDLPSLARILSAR